MKKRRLANLGCCCLIWLIYGCQPYASLLSEGAGAHGTLDISVKLMNDCLRLRGELIESKTLYEEKIDAAAFFCALAQNQLKGKAHYKEEPWTWSRHAEEAHNTCTFHANRYGDLISKKEPLTTWFLFTYLYECRIARMYY